MATQANMNMFPGGFASGLVVRGVPLVQTNPGLVWWVYNGTTFPSGGTSQRQPFVSGSDSNNGSFAKPFATLAYAATQASRGDIIFVKPGHAETYAAATTWTFNADGVAVIGLGSGAARPKITFSTLTTAKINIVNSNVIIQNFLFLCTIDQQVTAINVANAQVATDLVVDNCEFRDASATALLACVKIGTTANIADGLTFTSNKVFFAGTGGTTSQAVVTASIINRLTVSNNFVVGSATTAQTGVLLGLGTSLNHTNVLLSGNKVVTPTTDSTNGSAVNGSGTMTGLAADNYIANLDNTASIWIPTSLGLMYVQNFSHITAAADKNALINPSAV